MLSYASVAVGSPVFVARKIRSRILGIHTPSLSSESP
jgi:hypothetical protein